MSYGPPPRHSTSDVSAKSKFVIGIVIALFVGLFFFSQVGNVFSAEESTAVPSFQQRDSADLSKRLQPAEQKHGICYGWELTDASLNDVISFGSSRGPGTDAAQCERWMKFTADVMYTSEHSELEDSAFVSITSSSDLAADVPSSTELQDVGITEQALIEEPVSTVGYGTLALPLLLAERGVVQPVELEQGRPSGKVKPLDEAGSDFVSDNLGTLIFVGVTGTAALACVVFGFVAMRRRKRPRLSGVPGGPGADGPAPRGPGGLGGPGGAPSRPGQQAYWEGVPEHGPPPRSPASPPGGSPGEPREDSRGESPDDGPGEAPDQPPPHQR